MKIRRFILGIVLFASGAIGIWSIIFYFALTGITAHSAEDTLYSMMRIYQLDSFFIISVISIVIGLILAISTLRSD